jgi:hypothetical protein
MRAGRDPNGQSTDTSVALAEILKRECAGGLGARVLGAVPDSHLRLHLARADWAFLKVLVTRVDARLTRENACP